MKIDYHKLVELLLPTFLRKPRVIALLHVLVAKPLQSLFTKFHIWRLNSRYEATVTPQVCSLIHAIERTFDCVCEITELDGKPFDFLVEIDRSTDLNAIREFIDKHKLAGKSFTFRLGDVKFAAEWLNHVDEDIIELWSAEWIEYVNEEDGVNGIQIDIQQESSEEWIATARSEKPVKSILEIQVTAYYRPVGGPLAVAGFTSIPMYEGESTASARIYMQADVVNITEVKGWVYPASDFYYTYIITGNKWQ